MNPDEQLLYDLVAIQSYSRQESNAVEYLVGAMVERGFIGYRDNAGNAVGRLECPDENGAISREILLLGHIDTVSGEIPVKIVDGKLFGRGTVDAKGPLATFVAAASQVELLPGTRLIVVGAVEEEAATSKGARQVAEDFRPDFCIIGEPSGADAVTLGYKGRLLLDYQLRIPAGHSAGPQPAAPELAVTWWQQIRTYTDAFNEDTPKLFDQLLPSLRHIQSNSDGLYEEVLMTVGLRLPPGFATSPFLLEVEAWAGAATVRSYAYEPAHADARTSSLVRAFNRTWRESGQKPRYKLKTGTSDMNVVAPIWGCPIVAYGPGDSKLDHTPDEHIELEEYSAAITLLTSVLDKLQR